MYTKEGNEVISKYLGLQNIKNCHNSFDALIPAIEKLEGEDLSEYHYSWSDGRGEHNNFMGVRFSRFETQSDFCIELQLDPPIWIGAGKDKGIVKDTFKAVVEAITYINNLKQ